MNTVPTVGFISPPGLFDISPGEFPRAVEEPVRTQQAPLRGKSSNIGLSHIRNLKEEVRDNGLLLKRMGCDVVAQVGSPVAWAGAASESEARDRCTELSEAIGAPLFMTGLAIVDALRAHGVRRVAACCGYYEDVWAAAFAGFLSLCGFTVLHASGLAEQDLGSEQCRFNERHWCMDKDLTLRSVLSVVNAAPAAQAVVSTGAFTHAPHFMPQLEKEAGVPVVPGELALFWAVARFLGLTLKPGMGSLSRI